MMDNKYQALVARLREMNGVAVAFSGGVDSTFLLAAAREALGDRAVAVIGRSPTYPQREYREALRLAGEIGAPVRVIDTLELNDPNFRSNPQNRCFACKTELFTKVLALAKDEGLSTVVEGSNADDLGDFRPGMKAGKSLGVKAPLVELGFTKKEIRACSKRIGLSTWNKPAFACLSSRIPYGEAISEDRLSRIERAEDAMRDMGFVQLRVRDHGGSIARIEVGADDISRLADPHIRGQATRALKALGYQYVCVDLDGYRTGSMNEVLVQK
ncbi:MAG: ATP-dependent sacrificial sulfur transferase LarE [Proteobacteria bacterium]|nr:ATP-dependent sacrificial sulfur transferase LarE [Pseudomonadota bacterium]